VLSVVHHLLLVIQDQVVVVIGSLAAAVADVVEMVEVLVDHTLVQVMLITAPLMVQVQNQTVPNLDRLTVDLVVLDLVVKLVLVLLMVDMVVLVWL
jgi:hypothetical protein